MIHIQNFRLYTLSSAGTSSLCRTPKLPVPLKQGRPTIIRLDGDLKSSFFPAIKFFMINSRVKKGCYTFIIWEPGFTKYQILFHYVLNAY